MTHKLILFLIRNYHKLHCLWLWIHILWQFECLNGYDFHLKYERPSKSNVRSILKGVSIMKEQLVKVMK